MENQQFTPQHLYVSGFDDLIHCPAFASFVRRLKLIQDIDQMIQENEKMSSDRYRQLLGEKETLRSMNMRYVVNFCK